MDVGCYPISFSRLIAGAEPDEAEYRAELAGDGYDAAGAGLLKFPEMRATFATAVHATMTNTASVYGESGRIVVEAPWFCNGKVILYRSGSDLEELVMPTVPDLWGNQASVVESYLDQRECPYMSHDDTLGNMRTIDALRASSEMTPISLVTWES
jgi:predicted dehydrogenase